MNPKIKKIIMREGAFSLLLFAGIALLILEQNYILTGVAETFVWMSSPGYQDTPAKMAARHQRDILESASHYIGIGLILVYCCYLIIRLTTWAIKKLKKP